MKLNDILVESIQSIVNLGIPKSLASIFMKKFAKNSFIVAKWFSEYYNKTIIKNWIENFKRTYPKLGVYIDLVDSLESKESYQKAAKFHGLDDDGDGFYDISHHIALKKELEEDFLNIGFFSIEIISDLMSGKLKDIKKYEKLNFFEANNLYSKKTTYKNKKPLKIYDDGYRWVDVGRRSNYVGSLMKNCGSASLMSCDPNSSLIVLFDKNDKPHIIVTYSPNDNKISYPQGVASSSVKMEYVFYLKDLLKFLGAELIDHENKARIIILKKKMGNDIQWIKEIRTSNDTIYEFKKDGINYYTDGYKYVSAKDAKEYASSHGIKDEFPSKIFYLKNNEKVKPISDLFVN